jgi:hypothetical protein
MTHFNKYNVVPNTSVSSAQLLLHSNFGIFSYSNQHFVNTRFFVYLIFQKKSKIVYLFAIGSAQWQNRFYHHLMLAYKRRYVLK